MSLNTIIAGVGPGLGAALARKFSSEGCRVAMLARTRNYLTAGKPITSPFSPRISRVSVDLTNPNQIARASKELRSQMASTSSMWFWTAGLIRQQCAGSIIQRRMNHCCRPKRLPSVLFVCITKTRCVDRRSGFASVQRTGSLSGRSCFSTPSPRPTIRAHAIQTLSTWRHFQCQGHRCSPLSGYRLLQICKQIIECLNAHRQPDQAV